LSPSFRLAVVCDGIGETGTGWQSKLSTGTGKPLSIKSLNCWEINTVSGTGTFPFEVLKNQVKLFTNLKPRPEVQYLEGPNSSFDTCSVPVLFLFFILFFSCECLANEISPQVLKSSCS
jgi:hypothetical protein